MSFCKFSVNEFEAEDVEEVQKPLHELSVQNVFYENRKGNQSESCELEKQSWNKNFKEFVSSSFGSYQTALSSFVVTKSCVFGTKVIKSVHVKSLPLPSKACSTKIFPIFFL